MSSTQIGIIVAVGVSAIAVLGCLALVVLARLRRVIKAQFETLESLLGAVRAGQAAGQAQDKPSEPS